ncbi:hypothetical protein OIU74_006927 [Salix koriyanagi]|uniref:Uncharacterized protein n=1 Tax=Salix koriyanagi TaxID=2511006 RepID=A0A9Q0U2H8_9ROSI|nr:hypothetical protein OIU74_006927 [Salix koriyanagi]
MEKGLPTVRGCCHVVGEGAARAVRRKWRSRGVAGGRPGKGLAEGGEKREGGLQGAWRKRGKGKKKWGKWGAAAVPRGAGGCNPGRE